MLPQLVRIGSRYIDRGSVGTLPSRTPHDDSAQEERSSHDIAEDLRLKHRDAAGQVEEVHRGFHCRTELVPFLRRRF